MRSCFKAFFGGITVTFSASSIYDRHLIREAARMRQHEAWSKRKKE
jgi:hypothetical protein